MSAPDVSIVIPSFNHAHFLGDAIDSARRQRGVAAEIIVVDDGSTDATSRVAESYPGVRLLRQRNLGLSAARNAGLMIACAEYVIFLDADDMLMPDAAAIGRGLLENRPDAAIACGRCRLVDRTGRDLETGAPPPVPERAYGDLLAANFIWTPGAAVCRRSVVVAAGGFSLVHAAAADYGLYLALARSHAVLAHTREVVLYRQHDTNMSNDPVLMLRTTLAVLDAERAHVTPEWRAAYGHGRRVWKDFYGDRIANEIRTLIRTRGSIRAAARLAAALLWYHPIGFGRHVARKIGTTLGIRQAEPDPSPKPPRPTDATRRETAGGERMARSQPVR